jgi:hypothetical protein
MQGGLRLTTLPHGFAPVRLCLKRPQAQRNPHGCWVSCSLRLCACTFYIPSNDKVDRGGDNNTPVRRDTYKRVGRSAEITGAPAQIGVSDCFAKTNRALVGLAGHRRTGALPAPRSIADCQERQRPAARACQATSLIRGGPCNG